MIRSLNILQEVATIYLIGNVQISPLALEVSEGLKFPQFLRDLSLIITVISTRNADN